jgi:flagellar protein FliS
MSFSSNARAAYLGAAVTTADPGRLLVMLCDRLVLDVSRASSCFADAAGTEARGHLRHAQDIVLELRASLVVDGFDGGRELAALYDYLLSRLLRASIDQDAEATAECLTLAESIADTWRTAASMMVRSA